MCKTMSIGPMHGSSNSCNPDREQRKSLFSILDASTYFDVVGQDRQGR
jgi:hypothetical protein